MMHWRLKNFFCLLESRRIASLYYKYDYITAYRKHTNLRVRKDPHEAIGGGWREIGQLQFNFLRDRGLYPANSLLDIGCGTLRAGRLLVDYLNENKYVGLDVSNKAIKYGKRLIREEGLRTKRPKLVLNKDGVLDFEEVVGPFDFVLAQSVFTHLPEEDISVCFKNLPKVMGEGGRFFFTYYEKEENSRPGLKDFRQTRTFFYELAKENNFKIYDWSAEYPHPRGQTMLEISY